MERSDCRSKWLMALGLGLSLVQIAGCSSDSDSCKTGGSRCGNAGTQCQVASTTPVAWTEQTTAGVPEGLFSPFSGACQSPFRWDGSGWSGSIAVEPVQGQSTITATVVLDPSSARLVTFASATCPNQLLVDGTVTLSLPEGMVADQHPVTLSTSAGLVPGSLGFALKESEIGPWVSLRKPDPAWSLGMTIEMNAPARGCAGQITLAAQKVGNGVGEGMGGPLASWSDTGCGVRESAVSLAEPWQGVDLAAAIATSFGNATLAGTWNDGSTTTVALHTSLAASAACAEPLAYGIVATVLVDVVASSADGRVLGLSGAANIRALVNQGTLLELQLVQSSDLACASTADTLAYTGADCATVSKVTAQMIFTRHPSNPTSDGGSIEFYVYNRQSAAAPGAADRVDRLVLGP
jgi:hypothetical protein